MPSELQDELRRFGHDVDTAPQEGLKGRPDSEVWEKAKLEDRFLITQDLDFSDIRAVAPGPHPGIMLLRIHPSCRQDLIDRVVEVFKTQPADSWRGCLVVVSPHKIRIRSQ